MFDPIAVQNEIDELIAPPRERIAIYSAVCRDKSGRLFPYVRHSYPLPEQDHDEIKDMLAYHTRLDLEEKGLRLEPNTSAHFSILE